VAAHCVCNNRNKIIEATQMKVYVGMNKVSDIKNQEARKEEVIVDKIIVHPNYICGKKSEISYDIGTYTFVCECV
jgi:hypothetical protein